MFSIKEIFSQTNFPQPILDKMLETRAPSLDAYRELLTKGKELDHAAFVADTTTRSFLTDDLNILRRYPLLKVDDDRVLILDLQLIAELLTQGVYFSIFNSLPSSKRDTFRDFWDICSRSTRWTCSQSFTRSCPDSFGRIWTTREDR